MVDIHTHVLPGVDDGANDVETALEMIRLEVAQGVKQIVFTPHYYGQKFSPERFLENRQKAFERISEKIEGVNVKLAAEVHFDEEKLVSNSALCRLAIEDTKYILLELPFTAAWTENLWFRLRDFISDTGYTPIIAHVERYAEIRKNPAYLSVLVDMGCLIQVNTRAFISKKTANMAFTMLKKGLVHCLGTDAHNLEDREPNYKETEALFEKLGEMESFRAIQKNMQTILNGERVKVPPYQGLKRFLKKYY
jgi:protein-tyrosine phosphatase